MDKRFTFGGTLRGIVLTTISIVLVLAGTSDAVFAAKEESATSSALTALKSAQKAKSEPEMITAIDALVTAHNDAEDKKQRAQVQSALGGLLSAKAQPEARSRAAYALGQLNDPAGAFKHLKSALPTAKTKPSDSFAQTVLTSLKNLKPEAATAPLIKLIGASKEPVVVARAADALGVHTDSKKRPQIATALLDRLAKSRKAFDKAERIKGNPAAKMAKQSMWMNAAPAIGEALDTLTGRKVTDPAKWLAAFAEVKNKAAALFPAK